MACNNSFPQISDELLADADAARNIAREALAKAEKTLHDANETLRTLKGMQQPISNHFEHMLLNITFCGNILIF